MSSSKAKNTKKPSKFRQSDPFYERECQKYDFPLPSREFITQVLTERGVPFSGKDPQASPEAQAELKKLTGQARVPVLFVGNEKIDGFESGQWHAALDRAGYPKSAKPVATTAEVPAAPPATPAVK